MSTHQTASKKEQLENELSRNNFFKVNNGEDQTPVQPRDFTALLTDEAIQSVTIIDQYWIRKPFIYAVICDISSDTTYFTVDPQLKHEHTQVKNELVYRIRRKLNNTEHDLQLDTGTSEEKTKILNEVVNLFNKPNALPDIATPTESDAGSTTRTAPGFLFKPVTDFLDEARRTEFTVQDGDIHVRTQNTDAVDKITVQRIVHHVQHEILDVTDIESVLADEHVTQLHTHNDQDVTVMHSEYGEITVHGGVKPVHC